MSTSNLLRDVRAHVIPKIQNYPERIVYHDFDMAMRLNANIEFIGKHSELTEDELNLAKCVGWFFCGSFDKMELFLEDGSLKNNNDSLNEEDAKKFFKSHPGHAAYKEEIVNGLLKIDFYKEAETPVERVVSDAITMDLVDTNENIHLKAMYQEMMLNDLSISKRNWYETILDMAHGLRFYTNYGKNELAPRVQIQISNLEKERKKVVKKEDQALKRELAISDKELKKLKKNLKNLSGRDERAIQTLFRTTSKNHYTLNEMVDRKASIMITVNSIILSVVVSGLVDRQGLSHDYFYLPIAILALASTISIFFAILSTRPVKTHGTFTEEEIRSKHGNLLYYGNFHEMAQRDFEWGMLQMLNDSDYLYGSLIRDIYFLGQTLQRKYSLIRFSLNSFLFGLIGSVVFFALLRIFVHVPH